MLDVTGAWIGKVTGALVRAPRTTMTATLYVSPTLTIKATWRFKRDARNRRHEMVVTFGRPNYVERKFITACKKAGEPFPIQRIQFRRWPVKRGV